VGNVAVIGAGAWGSALASLAARTKHNVRIWALEPNVVADINERQVNSTYLPNVQLTETKGALVASSDLAAVVQGADLVIMVPPSSHLRSVSARVVGHIAPDAQIVVATKGIEESSLKLMSEVLAETMPGIPAERIAFLSGPNFAREVAGGMPTDAVCASKGAEVVRATQEKLHSPRFRVYGSADPVGVQVGGSIKNVIAIAAGACDALNLGLNARAALITRGLTEMARLGVALGADPLTCMGMAGVGDLILTCTGDLSRNRTLGMKMAEGVDPQEFLAGQRSVAEGYSTSAAAYELAKRLNVDMPITEQVYQVLHHKRPLIEALRMLLTREFKEELRGIR
jgi:glycerol-3-phosphate dehydrogenase (NAD(P)+)